MVASTISTRVVAGTPALLRSRKMHQLMEAGTLAVAVVGNLKMSLGSMSSSTEFVQLFLNEITRLKEII